MWAQAELTVETLRGEAAAWHPLTLADVSLRAHFARRVNEASAFFKDAHADAADALVSSLCEPPFDDEWRVQLFAASVLARADPPRTAPAARTPVGARVLARRRPRECAVLPA